MSRCFKQLKRVHPHCAFGFIWLGNLFHSIIYLTIYTKVCVVCTVKRVSFPGGKAGSRWRDPRLNLAVPFLKMLSTVNIAEARSIYYQINTLRVRFCFYTCMCARSQVCPCVGTRACVISNSILLRVCVSDYVFVCVSLCLRTYRLRSSQ